MSRRIEESTRCSGSWQLASIHPQFVPPLRASLRIDLSAILRQLSRHFAYLVLGTSGMCNAKLSVAERCRVPTMSAENVIFRLRAAISSKPYAAGSGLLRRRIRRFVGMAR